MIEERERGETPEPYRTLGEAARFFKALLQMAVGTVGALIVIVRVGIDALHRNLDAAQVTSHLFINIGLTLGVAAAVELAYTLFTHGADEAVDPVMLGIAAALLLQLGQVGVFDLKQGFSALLFVTALGAMFVVRNRLAHVREPGEWSPAWWSWVRMAVGRADREDLGQTKQPAEQPSLRTATDTSGPHRKVCADQDYDHH
ncbi:hypothetical protein AB0H28_29120 [Micromonospora sp. NPDC050980]|uniref:hypothetical protein n=1 Tax=Micromonospora sp. NPDC050980 TaxID=3155161 RepID=UPI003411B8AF